jgi:hypothetical protein
MKKKILPLVCILLLNSTLYAKSENDLPPLPISQSTINESQNTQSIWKRTLNFYFLELLIIKPSCSHFERISWSKFMHRTI